MNQVMSTHIAHTTIGLPAMLLLTTILINTTHSLNSSTAINSLTARTSTVTYILPTHNTSIALNTTLQDTNIRLTSPSLNFSTNRSYTVPNNITLTTPATFWNLDMMPCLSIDCIFERYRRNSYYELLHLSLFLGFIGLIGGIGNIIVIMVFARNRVKKPSTYFMLTLAIIDFMVCVVVIPGVIAREWKIKFYTDVLCKGLEFMRSLMIPASALILVAIAFDRFFLICMSTKEVMTKFTTKIVIFVIMVIGMSLGVPPSLFMSVYVKDNDKMQNYQICLKSDKYMDDIAQYQYWYFVTALFGIMTCTILVLYILIFKKVLQQSRMWKNRRPKIFPQRRNTAGTFEDISVTRRTSANETKVLDISISSTIVNPSVKMETKNDPCTSGVNSKTLKARNSKQAMTASSSSTNIKTLSDIRKRSTHVKTTRILFIVTLVYIFSFLPTFLETNEVLEPNRYLTHVYFVNNAANPIIYSFMNAKFREEARRMYCKCIK